MITDLEIAILIAVIVTFLTNSVVLSIHSAMFKTMIVRLESAEHKLRALLDERVRALLDVRDAEFVDDGEIRPDDDSYIPVENRNPRQTNSSGVPIARNRQMVGDEPPAE